MKLGNTLRTIESSQVVDGICVTGEDKEIVKSHQPYGRRAYARYTLTATEGKRHW